MIHLICLFIFNRYNWLLGSTDMLSIFIFFNFKLTHTGQGLKPKLNTVIIVILVETKDVNFFFFFKLSLL